MIGARPAALLLALGTASLATTGVMALQPGDAAPSFSVPVLEGRAFTAPQPGRTTIIMAYRYGYDPAQMFMLNNGWSLEVSTSLLGMCRRSTGAADLCIRPEHEEEDEEQERQSGDHHHCVNAPSTLRRASCGWRPRRASTSSSCPPCRRPSWPRRWPSSSTTASCTPCRTRACPRTSSSSGVPDVARHAAACGGGGRGCSSGQERSHGPHALVCGCASLGYFDAMQPTLRPASPSRPLCACRLRQLNFGTTPASVAAPWLTQMLDTEWTAEGYSVTSSVQREWGQ